MNSSGAVFFVFLAAAAGCAPRSLIMTNPLGAQVYLGERLLGTTPVEFREAVATDVELRATKGPYSARRLFTCGNPAAADPGSKPATGKKPGLIAGKSCLPREVMLPLNGEIEVGAFSDRIDDQHKDIENTLDFLHKLGNPSNTLVVYDASGSMRWPLAGKSGQPRFIPGKKAIVGFLRRASALDNFGLEIYGHRLASGKEGTPEREASCKDIELLFPMKPLERKTFIATVNQLAEKDHRGDTPLEGALNQGISVLKDLPGDKKIVLVTDGEEECGGNPARAAQEAARFGIKVHVLAFGIGVTREGVVREERAAEIRRLLQECASNGGGLFFDTTGGDELYAAMVKVELAKFTYTIRGLDGGEALTGSLNQPLLLDPGRYEISFDTERPFTRRIEIKSGRKAKVSLTLASNGDPEIAVSYD